MTAVNLLFWMFFLAVAVLPMLRQRQLHRLRHQIIRSLERQRGSRVITMIHRQEAFSFFGFPFGRFITIEDSEQVLRAIRLTEPDVPIDMILHTPGGLVLASEQIAQAIRKHRGKVTVFIPHYSMSGGSLVALAADEIVMDENAVMGPVDPQLGNLPAASIMEAVREKGRDKLEDRTLIMADVAAKALEQVRSFVFELLRPRIGDEKAKTVTDSMTQGRWTHDFPLSPEILESLGLTVSTNLPREIYLLMELYPQVGQRRPSVQFIPVPYQRGEQD